MKKKKGGADILTNMLLSVDVARLRTRNQRARASPVHREDFTTPQASELLNENAFVHFTPIPISDANVTAAAAHKNLN